MGVKDPRGAREAVKAAVVAASVVALPLEGIGGCVAQAE
jgi:hypothetical protein